MADRTIAKFPEEVIRKEMRALARRVADLEARIAATEAKRSRRDPADRVIDAA